MHFLLIYLFIKKAIHYAGFFFFCFVLFMAPYFFFKTLRSNFFSEKKKKRKEKLKMSRSHRAAQENYATQDNSGMYHLMPWWHLPEWREEDERAFVRCGTSGLKHAFTSN